MGEKQFRLYEVTSTFTSKDAETGKEVSIEQIYLVEASSAASARKHVQARHTIAATIATGVRVAALMADGYKPEQAKEDS